MYSLIIKIIPISFISQHFSQPFKQVNNYRLCRLTENLIFAWDEEVKPFFYFFNIFKFSVKQGVLYRWVQIITKALHPMSMSSRAKQSSFLINFI